MIVYMLRNKAGKYYKRGMTWGDPWVKQEEASIWPTKNGPASAKSSFTAADMSTKGMEIVEFEIRPVVKLALVTTEDWEGLYVDGALRYEGHHVHRDIMLNAVGVDLEVYDADHEWLGERGDLPPKLEDVVVEA